MKTYVVYFTTADNEYKAMKVKAPTATEAKKAVRKANDNPIDIYETCVMNDWNFMN